MDGFLFCIKSILWGHFAWGVAKGMKDKLTNLYINIVVPKKTDFQVGNRLAEICNVNSR
jgi:hypothetical protein